MLETEEVDDEFFAPVAGTSLANIFGNISKNKETVENNSLKYVPPKPQNIVPKKKELTKATECLFACALIGHEWCNNVYTSRGKLGFAIVKIQKTGDHNMVLYDSNKTTLSSTSITTSLKVTIEKKSYISYYDNLKKYWSIYGTDEEAAKITEILISLGANVNYSSDKEKKLPETNNSEIEGNIPIEESEEQQNRESDTDSSLNRKTKASILNRMANMGHSVLPTRTLPIEKSSDSSDTNETQPKVLRHKTNKPSMKRNIVENTSSESQSAKEVHQRIVTTKRETDYNMPGHSSSQLMPLANTSIIANSSSELSMLMSEQRITSSELRININRITDKVDAVLDKINNLEPKDKNTNVSTDILMKLLTEYENKIKVYEELLSSSNIDNKKVIGGNSKLFNGDSEVKDLKKKLTEMEMKNDKSSEEISNLQKELRLLQDKHSQENLNQLTKENELLNKVNSLESDLKLKSKELTDILTNSNASTDIGSKVKKIMTDTFQTLCLNFESTESYTGENIMRIIGTAIRKITIETLSDLQQNE